MKKFLLRKPLLFSTGGEWFHLPLSGSLRELPDKMLRKLSADVPDGQSAACWDQCGWGTGP